MRSESKPRGRSCLVLLSGGIDSATAAYWMISRGYKVEALFFDFGRSDIDGPRRSARIIAEHLGVYLHVVKTALWGELLEHIARSNQSYSLNAGTKDERLLLFCNVSCLCSMAMTYASMLNITTIVLGINQGDMDTSKGLDALLRMSTKLMAEMTTSELKILMPFIRKDKAVILRTSMRLGVPLTDTWSCGRDADLHCGTCIECQDRQRAFHEAALKDPTEYRIRPKQVGVHQQQD